MDIQPDTKQPQPACRVTGSLIARPVLIRGIAAEELLDRLSGKAGRWRWQRLAERGPIHISHSYDNISHFPSEAKCFQRNLDEGRVSLVSGGPAELVVETRHNDSGAILPRPLYLALAQQWAQDGVAALHAAAFELKGVGVLAIGPKGSGKSTLTAAVLAAGGNVASDDWVLLSFQGETARAERIRSFLMLRSGWARNKLSDQIKQFAPADVNGRPRQLIPIPAEHPRFSGVMRIDRIWLLSRPGSARSERSELLTASPAEVQSTLITAGMPILLSNQLPEERRELAALHRRLVSRLAGAKLQAGIDLVNSPQAVLQRLLDR